MPSSDAKMVWESEISDVARANAQLIKDFEAHDQKLKDVARSAGRAKRALKGATDTASRGAKTAKTELTGVEKATNAARITAASLTPRISFSSK